MTNIVFMSTPHFYDSYRDFFRLVELAGFPIMKLTDLDISMPGVFIGAPHNGEWVHIQNQIDAGRTRNAHIILWNIERPAGSAGAVGKYGERGRELLYSRQVDEVWVSDRQLGAETGLRFVPLGSHPDLGEPATPTQRRPYLFSHMSYVVPRRQAIYSAFEDKEIGPNCWPPKRGDVLRGSRFALGVHQDTYPFCEPLRFALFAAYGLPILTETVRDPFPYGGDTMEIVAYDYLVARLRLMDADNDHWREMGQRCRELMTVEYEFGKVVREAVEQSVGDWR